MTDDSNRRPPAAVTGLVLFIGGVSLLALLLLFEPFLRRSDLVDLNVGVWLGLACVALAVVFGWMSRRSRLGRTVCLLAGLVCLGLLTWLMTPSTGPLPHPQ